MLSILEHGVAQESWFPSGAVQALVTQVRQVPSPPTIYFQIASAMESPETSVERVSDLIDRHPVIKSKLVQLASSGVFGVRQKVFRPVDAVVALGLAATKALALFVHAVAPFDQSQLGGLSVDSLWWHSVATGRFAQRLARLEKSTDEVSDPAWPLAAVYTANAMAHRARSDQPLAAECDLDWNSRNALERIGPEAGAEAGVECGGDRTGGYASSMTSSFRRSPNSVTASLRSP